MSRLGDDPRIDAAIQKVANARNESYLMNDAKAFIEEGVRPDELPSGRKYRWPYPDERPDGGRRTYKSALQFVLRRYYEEHGYPDEDD